MPHPISYVKAHPTATIVTAAAGMIVGPWVLQMLGNATGVNVNLPSYTVNKG
jgi:hypothetical protein